MNDLLSLTLINRFQMYLEGLLRNEFGIFRMIIRQMIQFRQQSMSKSKQRCRSTDHQQILRQRNAHVHAGLWVGQPISCFFSRGTYNWAAFDSIPPPLPLIFFPATHPVRKSMIFFPNKAIKQYLIGLNSVELYSSSQNLLFDTTKSVKASIFKLLIPPPSKPFDFIPPPLRGGGKYWTIITPVLFMYISRRQGETCLVWSQELSKSSFTN